MYDLTKIYKSKAQAVNAIRMTARNKGWNVLDTAAAEQHVWPASEGYAVNNTTLNIAMGFAKEVVQGAAELVITDGKTLEAVSAAIEEQKAKDAVAPKLQTASNMEKAKKENLAPKAKKADKSPKGTGEDGKSVARCEVVNGARRPLREGKTLDVWLTTERLQKETGVCPSCKEVLAALEAQHGSFNKTTCSIQFYACRTYNGWEAKKESK